MSKKKNEKIPKKGDFKESKVGELLHFLAVLIEEDGAQMKKERKGIRKEFLYFIGLPSFKLSARDRQFCKDVLDFLIKKEGKTIDIEVILRNNKIPNTNQERNRLFNKITKAVYCFLEHLPNLNKENRQMPKVYSLMNRLRQNGLGKNYRAMKKDTLDNLNAQKQSLFSSYYRYLLERLLLADARHDRKNALKGIEELKKLRRYLFDFYTENDLVLLCEIINRTFQEKRAEIMLPNFGQQHDLSVVAQIFRNFCKMHLNNNEENYFVENKRLLLESQEQLSSTINKMCYEELLKFCIIQNNQGNKNYAATYIEIIEQMEQSEGNLLLENGNIPLARYKNVITMGLAAKDDGFVEGFIKSYIDKIVRPDGINDYTLEDIRDYHLAEVFLFRGKTQQAKKLLPSYRKISNDFYYTVGLRRLEMKICYELKEDKEMKIAIKRLKDYLYANKKMDKQYKTSIYQFIEVFKKLVNEGSLDSNQIPQTLAISDYNWLKKMSESKSDI